MSGILSAGLGLAQGVLGLGQTIAGLAKKKPDIPEYDIPDEVYQNMSQAEYESFIGLPEAQKREFIDNSQRGIQTTLAASTSRKGGLGIAAGAAQQMSDDSKALLSADAQARMEKQGMVYSMRDRVAQEKAKKQEVRRENIMQRRAEIDEMRGAGLQNVMGSLGSLIGIEGENSGLSDLFNKIFPGKKSSGTISV